MGKVLGLSTNNTKYTDVPDSLKWAIPLHEWISSPQMSADARRLDREADARIREAEKAEMRVLLKAVPKKHI